ncbi:MAG: hypothetical protein ACI93R_000236 [Flavobacteriales bacterium]|jgi:hypothetical protein
MNSILTPYCKTLVNYVRKRTKLFVLLLVTLILSSLTGCSSNLSDYSSSKPNFDMKEFFDGNLSAYGMVQDRSGKVIRRFHVDLVGTWEGNTGTLEEDFYYDDGETQRRVWTLIKQEDGSYTGTASDVTQIAFGRSKGFAFNWHYTLAINIEGDTWNIDLNDWLYQLDSSRLINRTKMSKWGFRVGEITLIIEKDEPAEQE